MESFLDGVSSDFSFIAKDCGSYAERIGMIVVVDVAFDKII